MTFIHINVKAHAAAVQIQSRGTNAPLHWGGLNDCLIHCRIQHTPQWHSCMSAEYLDRIEPYALAKYKVIFHILTSGEREDTTTTPLIFFPCFPIYFYSLCVSFINTRMDTPNYTVVYSDVSGWFFFTKRANNYGNIHINTLCPEKNEATTSMQITELVWQQF